MGLVLVDGFLCPSTAILICTDGLFIRSNSALFKAASGFPWFHARTHPQHKNIKLKTNPGMIPTAFRRKKNKLISIRLQMDVQQMKESLGEFAATFNPKQEDGFLVVMQ